MSYQQTAVQQNTAATTLGSLSKSLISFERPRERDNVSLNDRKEAMEKQKAAKEAQMAEAEARRNEEQSNWLKSLLSVVPMLGGPIAALGTMLGGPASGFANLVSSVVAPVTNALKSAGDAVSSFIKKLF